VLLSVVTEINQDNKSKSCITMNSAFML